MNNISDFAENLILNEVKDISEGKASAPAMNKNTPAAPAGKDIRNVSVPDSFMQEILGEEFVPSAQEEEEIISTPVSTVEEPEEINNLMISEGKVDELLVLLREVKELLSEMTMATTTTGQIGVNFGGPGKQSKAKPQRGYPKSKKATLPSNLKSARDIFRQSLASKRRR
jgi:hypothetical protein